jgi:ubiquinone/menaquinone biosynthesis C-methylase UbiE
MSIHDSSFHAFEQAGWQNAAAAYCDYFGNVTTQSLGPLLEAVQAGPGTRLLDVATGPGFVAAAARERGASVVGIDFALAVVELARQVHPDVDFREGDAEDLAFPDAHFDAVVMNYGAPHLGRPEHAFAEAFRVLAPGGRYAFTAWAKPEQAIGFGIVLGAIQAHGDLNVPVPAGPPFFRFGDEGECRQALAEAGFVDIKIAVVPQTWRLPAPDGLFLAFLDGAVRTAAILRGQTPRALEAIRLAVREAAATYYRDGAIEVPMPAVLASGTVPS